MKWNKWIQYWLTEQEQEEALRAKTETQLHDDCHMR